MKPFPEYRDWIQRPGDSSLNITSGAYAAQREAYYRDAGALIPGEKSVGGIDANPHPSVQVWSRGELFPAVIVVAESYNDWFSYASWSGIQNRNGNDASKEAWMKAGEEFYQVPLALRLRYRSWTVILDGEEVEGYASRDEAEQGARGMLAQRAARSVA